MSAIEMPGRLPIWQRLVFAIPLFGWMARDAAAMERVKASGIDENKDSYTKDLEKIIGKPPETIAGYLSHKSAMRPGMKFP